MDLALALRGCRAPYGERLRVRESLHSPESPGQRRQRDPRWLSRDRQWVGWAGVGVWQEVGRAAGQIPHGARSACFSCLRLPARDLGCLPLLSFLCFWPPPDSWTHFSSSFPSFCYDITECLSHSGSVTQRSQCPAAAFFSTVPPPPSQGALCLLRSRAHAPPSLCWLCLDISHTMRGLGIWLFLSVNVVHFWGSSLLDHRPGTGSLFVGASSPLLVSTTLL